MKKILLFISFLFPFFAFTQIQDWDISVLNQKVYLSSPNGILKLYYVDSVEVFPDYRKHYFGAKYLTKEFDTCYDEIFNFNPPNELIEQPLKYWYSNNLYFYFLENTDTVRFYNKSPIGFSWMIPNHNSNNNYNQIQLTCTAKEEFSFLGLTDSIRVFELQVFQNNVPVPNDLNGAEIRLSKNHGFIEQYFLSELVSTDNSNPVLYKTEGIHSNTISTGFDFQFDRMMQNFAVGDVYKWKAKFFRENSFEKRNSIF